MMRSLGPRAFRRVGLLGFVMLVSQPVAGGAHAETPDEVATTLAAIDAVLAPAGARRVDASRSSTERMGGTLCSATPREPGAWNRDFLCDATTLVGRWTLQNLRADGGQRVSANLEVRRFTSTERGQSAKDTALERYGGENASLSEGAISWCFLDVSWTEEVVFSLWYGCDISLPHVKALQSVRSELLKVGKPFRETGVVGVAGTHSGWSYLLDAEGRKRAPLVDEARFRHFLKVVDVAADDVLWLRGRPQSSALGAKLDKLPATATCVPLVFTPPSRAQELKGWVRVKFNGREGWVKQRYVAEQPASECSSRQ
ncbi:hypothetical protein [Myxococcus sp. AB056]|uniref:hypothetical protein n=1 Tax=Myxococcus sp. AB056 TaxID=2562792 RepID=UPI00114776E8|nr:hypothetical protein [Myxococcus sp. AB056]